MSELTFWNIKENLLAKQDLVQAFLAKDIKEHLAINQTIDKIYQQLGYLQLHEITHNSKVKVNYDAEFGKFED